MPTCSCALRVTIFSNSSIIPTSFKFTELHALTLAARSYVLLMHLYLSCVRAKNTAQSLLRDVGWCCSTIAIKSGVEAWDVL